MRVEQSTYDDNPPIPAAQIEATSFEAKQKPEIIDDNDSVSCLPAFQYEVYEGTNKAEKRCEIFEDDDLPPLPTLQLPCAYDSMGDPKRSTDNSFHQEPPRAMHISNIHQQHVAPQPQPAVPYSPPSDLTRVEHNQAPSSIDREEVVLDIPSIPPPVCLDPSIEADNSLLPVLHAQVVVDEPARPIYNAVEVDNCTWWKRNQKYLFVGLVSVIIGAMAATIVMLIGSSEEDGNKAPGNIPISAFGVEVLNQSWIVARKSKSFNTDMFERPLLECFLTYLYHNTTFKVSVPPKE